MRKNCHTCNPKRKIGDTFHVGKTLYTIIDKDGDDYKVQTPDGRVYDMEGIELESYPNPAPKHLLDITGLNWYALLKPNEVEIYQMSDIEFDDFITKYINRHEYEAVLKSSTKHGLEQLLKDYYSGEFVGGR